MLFPTPLLFYREHIHYNYCMLLVCTRVLLICIRMLLVCTRVLLVCTRMYLCVTRMYSCGVLVTIVCAHIHFATFVF
jgi:hypothetical protein